MKWSRDWRRRVELLTARLEKMTPDKWRASISGRCLPLAEVLPDDAWKGGPAFIVGGGPSLLGFDFNRLPADRTIVINRAFESMPQAAVLFSMDSLYHHEAVKTPGTDPGRFGGLRVWLDTFGYEYRDLLLVKSRGECGLSESLGLGLYHGSNSGYGALGLAVCLGANPIYLLGYDLDFAGPRTHFHSGYRMRTSQAKTERYIKNFEALAPLLEARGVEVINFSLDSALSCFRKQSVDEVLK